MSVDDNDPEVRRVRLQVRAFRQHLTSYLTVVALLFVINLLTGGIWGSHWWFQWVALVWGVFLAMEAVTLFGHDVCKDWENRMVDQVMARRRGEQPKQPAAPSNWTPPQPPRPSPPPST
ncbi:MAG: 2TM domain-containing protein [Proteobacteria bacterium]|nr:2TM domain-containing protein [Pseudomonadota bacterium]